MLFMDNRNHRPTASTRVRRITLALLMVLALLAMLPLATPARAHLVEQVQLAGGGSNDTGHGIADDAAGNRYISGSFQNRATFGSGSNAVSLTSRGADDAFVAKYDAAGALVWARQVGGSITDQGRGITVAADGSVYVTGLFNTQAEFVGSGVRINSRSSGDIFVTRYNPDGQLIWALRAGGTAGDIGLGGTDIDAFEWREGSTLFMSFDTPITLPGIPFEVDESDIVRFIPIQLGATTSGSFQFFFDGSDVGLTTDAEDVDAIAFSNIGRLMISTIGPARVPGVGGEFNASDEDVLAFSGDRFGEATRGSWDLFYDSSSKGFVGEVVDAFSVGDSGVLGDIGDGDDTEAGPPEDPGEAPNDPSSVFLPLVSR